MSCVVVNDSATWLAFVSGLIIGSVSGFVVTVGVVARVLFDGARKASRDE